ncbi:hypothetical protein B0H17DRAFT_1181342 [Mycena rosella]|uniref:Uncharacterized protein n=1 Tax=Mycena rosella TaxID=1033263 RepID=A0AAD7DCF7_MYCRO|nr:hypothetical protein B0H17DRAFT_1181342 [Mycena rosella]
MRCAPWPDSWMWNLFFRLSMAINHPSDDVDFDSDDEDNEEISQLTTIDTTLLLLDIAFEVPHLRKLFITMTQMYPGQTTRSCGTGRLRREDEWLAVVKDSVGHYRILPEAAKKRMPFSLYLGESDRIYRLGPSCESDGAWRFFDRRRLWLGKGSGYAGARVGLAKDILHRCPSSADTN